MGAMCLVLRDDNLSIKSKFGIFVLIWKISAAEWVLLRCLNLSCH